MTATLLHGGLVSSRQVTSKPKILLQSPQKYGLDPGFGKNLSRTPAPGVKYFQISDPAPQGRRIHDKDALDIVPLTPLSSSSLFVLCLKYYAARIKLMSYCYQNERVTENLVAPSMRKTVQVSVQDAK